MHFLKKSKVCRFSAAFSRLVSPVLADKRRRVAVSNPTKSTIDQQSIGTSFIPSHKLKDNCLDYFTEFAENNKRKGNRHLEEALFWCLTKLIVAVARQYKKIKDEPNPGPQRKDSIVDVAFAVKRDGTVGKQDHSGSTGRSQIA